MKKLFLTTLVLIFIAACGTTNAPQPAPIVPLTVTPISSATPLPTARPTATQVVLNVSPDVLTILQNEHVLNPDGSLKTNIINEETPRNLKIDPALIQYTEVQNALVSGVEWFVDPSDGIKYVWNKEANGWGRYIEPNKDYDNWETAWQRVPMGAVTNGTANISQALFFAENPGLIPTDTTAHPYFKVNIQAPRVTKEWYFTLGLIRDNQHLFTGPNETIVTKKTEKPIEFLGGIIVYDAQGNEFPTIVKANWDPTVSKPEQITPTYFAHSSDRFKAIMQYDTYVNSLQTESDDLVAVFPPPSGTFSFNADTFHVGNQKVDPPVARLQSQNAINMFSATEQQEIRAIFEAIAQGNIPGASPESSNSVAIEHLPLGISTMLLFPAKDSWY